MQPAVFLDRDGVLIRTFLHQDGKTHPAASLEEVEILPGVEKACHHLRRAGFLLIVVTNQPDVARGTQVREVVEAINDRLRQDLPLDDFRVCYHDNHDGCDCRKPKPGLILSAVAAWGVDLPHSFLVGDRLTDIEAGRVAGCKVVLLGPQPRSQENHQPDFCAASLAEAAAWILQNHDKGTPSPGQAVRA